MKTILVLAAVVSLSHGVDRGAGLHPNGGEVIGRASCAATDKGLGVDPNGGARPASSATTDDGMGIDPNGGPKH
jgi:hypothetical protein